MAAREFVAEHGGTDPGFGSALTVVLAMGVLYVIVSGLWQRVGPAWRTLLHGGAGMIPKIPKDYGGPVAPWQWPQFIPQP